MKSIIETLKAAAEWHFAEADYWSMTRKQAWGRTKAMRENHKARERMHRKFGNACLE